MRRTARWGSFPLVTLLRCNTLCKCPMCIESKWCTAPLCSFLSSSACPPGSQVVYISRLPTPFCFLRVSYRTGRAGICPLVWERVIVGTQLLLAIASFPQQADNSPRWLQKGGWRWLTREDAQPCALPVSNVYCFQTHRQCGCSRAMPNGETLL